MNKFKKFKQSKFNYTEDSSDYISDAETSLSRGRFDTDSFHEGNSNSILGNVGFGDDYSNDSFNIDRDQEHDNYPTPSTTKAKNTNSGSRLTESLDYLHRMVIRKDKEAIFEFPVTDAIAPGYSIIIKNPMDLSTMKEKIDSNEYTNIMEYRDDLILMCENCMTYNKPDTIYYQSAKKMLDYGFKLLSRDKLFSLRNTSRCMRMLTSEELGFSLEASDLYYDTNAIRKKQSENKLAMFKVIENSIVLADSFENLDGTRKKETYLMPPEGQDETDLDLNEEEIQSRADEILLSVQQLAKQASDQFIQKNSKGKIGFLRRNSNGTTGYHIIDNSAALTCKSDEDPDENTTAEVEKSVTIGNLMDGLQQASYSMNNFIDEKKEKTKPMYYIENGPFSSQAPTEDTSFNKIPKEDISILKTSYGDEVGYQYALSLMEFSKDSSDEFNKYAKTMLNELSCNEHEKYLKYLTNKDTVETIAKPAVEVSASTPASVETK